MSQLFDRHLARTDIPRIRFHDLRHTHAEGVEMIVRAAGDPEGSDTIRASTVSLAEDLLAESKR